MCILLYVCILTLLYYTPYLYYSILYYTLYVTYTYNMPYIHKYTHPIYTPCYIPIGNFNDAKRQVEKSLELDKTYVKAWAKKGDIEFFMKE